MNIKLFAFAALFILCCLGCSSGDSAPTSLPDSVETKSAKEMEAQGAAKSKQSDEGLGQTRGGG